MNDVALMDLEAGVQPDADDLSNHNMPETEPQAQASSLPAGIESSSYPYHEQMKRLLERSDIHGDLRYLVAWDADLIYPHNPGRPYNPNLPSNTPSERIRLQCKTNVTIIEHVPDAEPVLTSINNVEMLRTALTTGIMSPHQYRESNQPALRICIVEDLSVDVVELLGSRFAIDPLFFSTQFENLDLSSSHEPMRLNLTKKLRKWFCVNSVRRYGTSAESESERKLYQGFKTFNVRREFSSDLDSQFYGRTRTSFWLDEEGSGGSFVGLMLVDPTASDTHFAYRDGPIPRTEASFLRQPGWGSWCIDIVEDTFWYFKSLSSPTGAAIHPVALVYPAMITICAEWLNLCHIAERKCSSAERGFANSSRYEVTERTTNIQKYIADLIPLNQQLQMWRDMVAATLNDALPAAARLTSSAHHTQSSDLFEKLGPELKSIMGQFEALQARVTRLIDGGVAQMQLIAARESLAESHNLARLSWLATIFVPLTFLSGMFSMSEDIGSLKGSFRYYFSIGVPLVIVALVVVRWGPNVARKVAKVLEVYALRSYVLASISWVYLQVLVSLVVLAPVKPLGLHLSKKYRGRKS